MIDVELARDEQAPARARAALEPLRDSLPSRDFDDLRLLVSELVVDDLRAQPGASDHEIQLEASLRDDVLRVALIEGRMSWASVSSRPEPGERGWGVYLAGLLADRWGVDPVSDGARLWLEKRVS
jgi:anti-sigma regulatory factor (Ser/Thr protein kinase)